MGYRYFVVFNGTYENKIKGVIGNAISVSDKKIETLDDIKLIERDLCEFHNLKTAIITNFIFLGTEINEDVLTKVCEAVINTENDGDHIPHID